MNRKTLFRGKVKHPDPMINPENGWVEGFYYEDLDGGIVKSYIYNCPMHWEVDKNTVGECTDMLDPNGKLIYEGDLIKNPRTGKILGSVAMERGGWVVNGTSISFILRIMKGEVLGNIHDNMALSGKIQLNNQPSGVK